MESPGACRTKLDQQRKPIAIVQDGGFVYANSAFLRRLGYHRFEELEASTVLDIVTERYHERLRAHLKDAQSTPESAPASPTAKVSMLKGDGSTFVAIISSQQTEFEGENFIQISMRTKEDASLKNAILNLPWKLYLSLAFLVFLSLLSPFMLLNLNVDNSPRTFLEEDAPAIVIDDALREIFPGDQVLLLLFEGVALYSDGFLNAFDQLANTLEDDPKIDRVVAVTNQDHIAADEEGFSVHPLIDVKTLDDTRPRQRLKQALEDRFATGTTIAADGSALAMIVIPKEDENSAQRLQFEDAVLEAVRQARLEGYLSALSGQISVDVAQFRSMLSDNSAFIPATILIGLLMLWWLYRRWLAVIIGGTVVGVVINSTVAFYVILDLPFTIVSSIISPLLSALTIAALIHLFTALRNASHRGFAGKKRVLHALAKIKRPARFASLTTAAGFASLGTSSIPAISNFGWIASGGILLVYFVVIVITPNIFAHWDYAPWPKARGSLRLVDRIVEWTLHLSIRRPIGVIALLIGGLAISIPYIWNIKVESNVQELFAKDHPVRVATDRIEDKLSGTTSLGIVFETPSSDGLKRVENLRSIRRFQDWVEQLPEVDKSISYVDAIEEMNWAFNAENPAYRKIPDDERLVSQYIFVYGGNDLYDLVDRDFRISRVNLNVNVHEATEIIRLVEKIKSYLEQQIGPQLEWNIAGHGRMFAEQAGLIVSGQVTSLWGALVLIFLLMLAQWRSFGASALCMLPNVAPILLVFIVMGITGIWLDIATVMIASIAVGIAVDDTIHVYHGFNSRVKKGVNPVTALVRTFHQAGRAVVSTTLILCAQFLILLASHFIPTGNFGLLTSIGLGAALVFDLLLLPAILILLHSRKSKTRSTAEPRT